MITMSLLSFGLLTACGEKEEDTAVVTDTADTEETDTEDTSDTEETDTEETDTEETDTEEPDPVDADNDGFTYCLDCDDEDAAVYPGSAYLESEDACMRDVDGDGWGEDLTDTCCFSLQLMDSYGNGWDGASVRIEQNGSLIDELTLIDGFEDVLEICLPNQQGFTLTYETGTWDGENTYDLYDPDGTKLYSDGPFPSISSVPIAVDFSSYTHPQCLDRVRYASGQDCDDFDPTKTAEDKDGDGSTLCDGDCDDFDPAITGADLDGDGFTMCTGDCDDNDPQDMLDRDLDGYSQCTGDCNDFNIFINEYSIEKVQDGIDQDCDGQDQSIFVSAGKDHTCAIGLEGKLGCWGSNLAISDMPILEDYTFISSGFGFIIFLKYSFLVLSFINFS